MGPNRMITLFRLEQYMSPVFVCGHYLLGQFTTPLALVELAVNLHFWRLKPLVSSTVKFT